MRPTNFSTRGRCVPSTSTARAAMLEPIRLLAAAVPPGDSSELKFFSGVKIFWLLLVCNENAYLVRKYPSCPQPDRCTASSNRRSGPACTCPFAASRWAARRQGERRTPAGVLPAFNSLLPDQGTAPSPLLCLPPHTRRSHRARPVARRSKKAHAAWPMDGVSRRSRDRRTPSTNLHAVVPAARGGSGSRTRIKFGFDDFACPRGGEAAANRTPGADDSPTTSCRCRQRSGASG